MPCRPIRSFIALLLFTSISSFAVDPPATRPVDGKLPFVQIDVKKKQVRIACEACSENMDVGLEFFCVAAGTNEYESVLRTKAKASHLHMGLLMVGLEPGEPVHYSEGAKKWLPPHGPPLQITCEWKDPKKGDLISVPAYRLMRFIKDKKKEIPPFSWIFAGSKIMEDGKYAADSVGYFVSVLNNELTVIDIPDLASRDIESRQLERNTDLLPPTGTEITMIVEPAAGTGGGGDAPKDAAPSTAPKVDAGEPDLGETIVSVDGNGVVKMDGMTVPVERLSKALADRRVKSKVKISAMLGTPPDVLAQVSQAVSAQKPATNPAGNVQVNIDASARVTVNGQPVEVDSLAENLSLLSKTSGPAKIDLQVNPGARKDVVEKVTDIVKAADLQVADNGPHLSDVSIDDAKVKALRQKWEMVVAPKATVLREAAQAHYEVIESLRREQQRLVDEADRIQRVIDQLQKDYTAITSPGPQGQ